MLDNWRVTDNQGRYFSSRQFTFVSSKSYFSGFYSNAYIKITDIHFPWKVKERSVLLRRLWGHQRLRHLARNLHVWQCAGCLFHTCTDVEKWIGFNIFPALHVQVRINEPGLIVYYFALWAVSWEPNHLSTLVYLLFGHPIILRWMVRVFCADSAESPAEVSQLPFTFVIHLRMWFTMFVRMLRT